MFIRKKRKYGYNKIFHFEPSDTGNAPVSWLLNYDNLPEKLRIVSVVCILRCWRQVC